MSDVCPSSRATNPSNPTATVVTANLVARELDFIPKKPSSDPDDYPAVMGLVFNKEDLIPAMEAEYDCENDFQQEAFLASTEMVGNALEACPPTQRPLTPVVNEKNIVIYEFKDEDKKKMGLYIGLEREGQHSRVKPDFAVALFRRTGDKPQSSTSETVSRKRKHSSTMQAGKKARINTDEQKDEQLDDLRQGDEQEDVQQETFKALKKSDFEFIGYVAVAEFKMPGPVTFTVRKSGFIHPPSFDPIYEFLNQEMLYVLDLVWPGLRGCGLSPPNIPLVGIVGKRKTRTSNDAVDDNKVEDQEKSLEVLNVDGRGNATISSQVQMANVHRENAMTPEIPTGKLLRYFQGALTPSKVCCDKFQYYITNFGTIGRDEEKNAEQAAIALKSVVVFGFTEAEEAVNALMMVSHGIPICKPLSGDDLIIEDVDSMIQLYPTPLKVLATPASKARHNAAVSVSLADLFEGTLPLATLQKLHEHLSDGAESLWFFSPTEKDGSDIIIPSEACGVSPSENDCSPTDSGCSVIVKVSSCAVHFQLVHRKKVFAALQKVEKEQALKDEFSKALLAVFVQPLGFVTIMRDLRKEGYRALRPSEFYKHHLWDAVCVLVDNVLVKMAIIGVVHYDIRSGYDVTSNIMVNDDLNLILIDYESLADFDSLTREAEETDGRYVGLGWGGNAVGYLWWQCVALALVWSKEISEAKLLSKTESITGLLFDLWTLATSVEISQADENDYTELESCLLSDRTIRDLVQKKGGKISVDHLRLLLERISQYFRQHP